MPSRGNSEAEVVPAPGRRSYDASRRQAEAVERRRRVIDAAHELFLSDGYGATSINEIARAADVSAQMIYASFGSKAGILAKLVDVVVAGDDAALHGDDGPLLRDRLTDEELFADDLRVRFRAIGRHAAGTHGRAGPVLQLIDSVAGSDAAVAELRAGLLAGHREDTGLAVAALPWDRLRPGLDRVTVSDLMYFVLGWHSYIALVLERGWTPEQYAERIADTMTHLLLPDDPA
jgi:AcrR family transcriptional regulator